MKKIILTGPESTGKTSLAKALSRTLGCPWVPEYARQYLDANGLAYQYEDLYKIAKGQYDLELAFAKKADDYLVLDTSFLVLKIWSEYRFQKLDPFIEHQFTNSESLFILCGTDVPWKADPQRENPLDREELYSIYKKTLEQYSKGYIEIRGTLEERVMEISRFIHR